MAAPIDDIAVKDAYDAASVKFVFDLNASRHFKTLGYEEDHTFSNVRIGLGVLAIVLSVVSHFAPIKFPDIVPLLIGCVSTYYASCAVLYYISFFHEKEYFFISKKSKGMPMLKAASRFDADTATYEIELEGTYAKSVSKPTPGKLYYGDFFSTDGLLQVDKYNSALDKQLRLLQSVSKKSN